MLADIRARFVRRRAGPFAEIQSGKERRYCSSLLYLGLFQGYFTDLSSVTNAVRDTLEKRELPLRGMRCRTKERPSALRDFANEETCSIIKLNREGRKKTQKKQ